MTPPTTTEIQARLTSAVGDTYEVERELGRGGMATVFLARDRKHERLVAIKVLHPELAASIGGERFLREIKLAATLQHPHVLGLYDSGTADGLLYYVMPYVDGESLRHRLEREPQLPIDDALLIGAEVANALAYAHTQGVVHRDIKPENVLLSNGHAIVADFGVARALGAASGEKLTESGVAIGTPHYMSPEQGTGGVTGPQSDVYAVGCLLYEMLVGEPPFTGPNAMAIIAKHAMADVPSTRIVRAAVPDDVDFIVQRALAKSPADRWASAAELEQSLRYASAMATHTFTNARPAIVGGRAVRRRSRGRGPIAATLGIAALLIGGGFYAYRAASTRPAAASTTAEARRIAVAYFDARGDSSLTAIADGFTEALTRALLDVPALSVATTNAMLPYRGGTAPRDSIARALRVGTLITGRVEPEASGRLRVSLELRDASGQTFADTSIVRPASEVLALRGDVIDEAAALIRQRLGEEIGVRASLAGTGSAEAWSLLQRGLAETKRAAAAVDAGDAAAVERADRAADSLLALAEARDATWSQPAVERARLAYAQSRRRGVDAAYAAPFIERGLAAADRAVTRDSSAAALGIRGMLRYWQWLVRVGSPELSARQALLSGAQGDLEAATARDPANADAWNSLSHLYANFKTVLDAKVAAKRAYDADPYLSGAPALLWRLYETSYDLGQFDDARRFCAEVRARFAASARGAECGLWLLSVPDAPTPSPAQAWEAAALRTKLTPPQQQPAAALDNALAVSAALARAGLRDSARHVAERAVNDSLARTLNRTRAAWALLTVGDRPGALDQLKLFVAEQGTTPDQARRITTQHWWWRGLRDTPEFRSIFGI